MLRQDWMNKFRQHPRWWGADGCHSVMISPTRRIYLFADTWLRRPPSFERSLATADFLNSTIGVQDNDGDLQFYTGPNNTNFFPYNEPMRVCWPNKILYRGGRLIVFAHIATYDANFPLGLRIVDVKRFVITNPHDAPTSWNIYMYDWSNEQPDMYFASEFFVGGPWMWIYGFKFMNNDYYPVVARTSVEAFDANNQCQWESWNGSGWSPGVINAQPLFTDEPSGNILTVTYDNGINKMIYISDIYSGQIRIRESNSPVGPWSPPRTLFTLSHPNSFFYMPSIIKSEGSDKLFAVSMNGSDLSDQQQYFPQIVQVPI